MTIPWFDNCQAIVGNVFVVRRGCKLKTICLDVIHIYIHVLFVSWAISIIERYTADEL